jgi:hypothetical protein
MLGFGKKKQVEGKKSTTIEFNITAPVLFHKECNGLAEHGKLCAEHATLGVSKFDGVRFRFDGIEPPMLTAEVMAYVTDQAERKGFVVHHLHSYVNVLNQLPSPVLRSKEEQPAPVLVSQRRETSEHRGHARLQRRPSGPRAEAAAS